MSFIIIWHNLHLGLYSSVVTTRRFLYRYSEHCGYHAMSRRMQAVLYDDIFVNCKWVVTRWQLYNTHLHTNNTQSDTKQTIHRTTQNLRIQKFWKSAGRAPSLRVIPWHSPYN